jgi:hypothetical protein
MDNWLTNIVGDVDSLHVEIDNLNDFIVGFCFIRSIDTPGPLTSLYYPNAPVWAAARWWGLRVSVVPSPEGIRVFFSPSLSAAAVASPLAGGAAVSLLAEACDRG